MKKTIDAIFKTIIIGGFMTAWAGTAAWAGVVEVSTLPGTAISQTVSANQVSASVNYSQTTPTTPVITAVTVPSDAGLGISCEDASTASSGTSVTAAFSTGKTASTPVIDAVGTADSYMNADASSSYTYAGSYASANSSSQSITDTTPVVVAGGSTDDASAQESTTSEVGFCVLLSSSPTGTMKDITG